MLVRNLNGAKPVHFNTKINFCPPDDGGEEYDDIEYIATCPECREELDQKYNYCPNCGQKLFWEVKWPEFKNFTKYNY